METKLGRMLILVLLILHEVVVLTSGTEMGPTMGPTIAPSPSPLSSTPATLPKIDTHTHFIPPFYRDLLLSNNISSGGFAIPQWDLSSHLALNAMVNIVTSVISVSVPGAKLFKDEPVENGRQLARELNLYAKNITVQFPKKFLFFATLTLPDLDGAVAEAIYALDTLGAAGVIVEASAFGELFGTRRYDSLYKVLNDRKAVVFVHPSRSPCPEPAEPGAQMLPPYLVDFLLDTVRAAVELVRTNVTTDFADITFLLAHSGGFLPFAAYRAAAGLAILSGNFSNGRVIAFVNELSQFNVDLAGSANPAALPSTLAFINESKITIGSDFPYAPIQTFQQSLASLENPAVRISQRVMQKIAYGNGFDLLRRFLI